MATPVPGMNELNTTVGLHRIFRDMYAKLDEMADLPERLSQNQQPDSNVVRLNPDGSLPAELVERFRTQLDYGAGANGGIPKHNWVATENPEPLINNLNEGYTPGSIWCHIDDTPLPSLWMCVESSSETAAWRRFDRA